MPDAQLVITWSRDDDVFFYKLPKLLYKLWFLHFGVAPIWMTWKVLLTSFILSLLHILTETVASVKEMVQSCLHHPFLTQLHFPFLGNFKLFIQYCGNVFSYELLTKFSALLLMLSFVNYSDDGMRKKARKYFRTFPFLFYIIFMSLGWKMNLMKYFYTVYDLSLW